jgi:hypothetical protein
MKRPTGLTWAAGSPTGALLICALIFYAAHEWSEGLLSGWWMLVAAAIGFQTVGAARKVNSYKQWRRQWDAIGQDDQHTGTREKHSRGSRPVRMQLAFLVCAALILLAENLEIVDFGEVVHWTAILYVVSFCVYHVMAKLLRKSGLRTPLFRGAVGSENTADRPKHVTWMLHRPALAPSRQFAERNLPEYCTRILSPSPERRGASGPYGERQD